MSAYIFDFREVDKTKAALVGGKGANLGELAKVEGINVPEGFCISTEAFKRIMNETPAINELLERLSLLKVDDRDKIVELKKQQGDTLTILTEFGPPTYMPTLPYTQEPLSNQWAINVHMKDLLRKRYS